EMPTRPLTGRERRVYAVVASLPSSGAQTAFFSLEMTLESFLEGHVRAFEWLGGVPRECVYDNLRAVVAHREGERIVWNRGFLHLRGHYGFHATACTPATPREKGSVEASVRLAKLKAPRVLERLEQTAALAREQDWPYERVLETLLEADVFARDASGARMRIRHAGFPALKTLEDFDWSAQPSAEKPLVLHLAQLAWIEER